MPDEITPERIITRLVALRQEEIKAIVLKKLSPETTPQCSDGSTFFRSTFSCDSKSTDIAKAPLLKEPLLFS